MFLPVDDTSERVFRPSGGPWFHVSPQNIVYIREDSSVLCTGRLFTISTTFARNSSVISVSTLMTRETSQIA